MARLQVNYEILNQKASPAIYASSLATRPAFGFQGRVFIDTDNPSTGIYRDTGSSWIQVADPGAGTSGTLQTVTTNGNSTNTGITVTANGIGIGTTIPAANRLDIHSSSGINATFNGTGTSNAALQLQLAGTGKWNLSNLYNAGGNDFIVNDVTNSLNRITVKNTGQTFIGADTTSSGLLVVNNASSDSHIVVLGANSPSIRLRDSGNSLVQNVGLGISTGTNAFIQGSASGNYCIFNSSSTASPILFGVYDAGTGNTQEAIRISAARNFLVGTATDSGYKLDVNGTGRFSGALTITNANINLSNNYFLSSKLISGTPISLIGVNSSDKLSIDLSGIGSNFGGSVQILGSITGQSSTNTFGSAIPSSNVEINMNGVANKANRIQFQESGTNKWLLGSGAASENGNFELYNTAGSVSLSFNKTNSVATFSSAVNIGNSVATGVAVASTHKVSILIGGVQYYLLASNV